VIALPGKVRTVSRQRGYPRCGVPSGKLSGAQPDLACHTVMNAQKQLILGSRAVHFPVNRIKHLEGVWRLGFWANLNGSGPVLRDVPETIELFSPNAKPVSRAITLDCRSARTSPNLDLDPCNEQPERTSNRASRNAPLTRARFVDEVRQATKWLKCHESCPTRKNVQNRTVSTA
jgi:hypothetical protein